MTDVKAELLEALKDARIDLSNTRANVMVELNKYDNQRWEGVPEALKARLEKIDAVIARAESQPALPEGVEAVAWRGEEIPYLCPLPALGRAGAPYAYNIDPGAGSAMDRLQRDWPDRAQVNDLRRRDGRVTPLYATPLPTGRDPVAVITEWAGALNGRFSRSDFPMISHRDIRDLAAVVVPKEPTEAMIEAGLCAYWPDSEFVEGPLTNGERTRRCWSAMLAAAPDPTPPASQEGES